MEARGSPVVDAAERSLSRCRVVELGTGSALAYAGKLLAAFGAEVIKVEPAEGDPGRREPPLVDTGAGRRESAYFAWLNVGKTSVCLDDSAAHALIGEADVLLDARAPGAGKAGELAHAALRSVNPALVIVAISWFGESGSYRNYLTTDATCRALAGLLSLIGPVERPVGINDHQADIVGGLSAYTAAVAGLLSSGRRFELSLHEAVMALSETHTAYGPTGPRTRLGNNRFSGTFPLGVYRCREGWLGVGVSSYAQWQTFCELFGMKAAAAHPDYALGVDRSARKDEIEPLFAPKLLERTAAEWFEEGMRRKLPFAIVPEMRDLLAQPVFRNDGAFATIEIGDASFEGPGVPFRPPLGPPASSGAASTLDTLGSAVARWRGGRRPARVGRAGAPLAGLRIVDLTMGWAGPLVTRTMADLGAEVIKVEACAHPDWWRGQDVRPAYFEQKLY
ncbi:MAG: CoA transferase, partial [Betaproteobacteria bacterium]